MEIFYIKLHTNYYIITLKNYTLANSFEIMFALTMLNNETKNIK